MSGALRLLVVATGISSMGNGLWLTSGVLFLVTSAGLSPIEVGVGLTVAGVVGVLAGVPIGAWADVAEPRRVAIAMLGLEAVATTGYAVVGSVQAFVPVAGWPGATRRGARCWQACSAPRVRLALAGCCARPPTSGSPSARCSPASCSPSTPDRSTSR
ncbi:hypothetical protein WEH80_35710 [Actinomycetes bacterium KLBMP 9759]